MSGLSEELSTTELIALSGQELLIPGAYPGLIPNYVPDDTLPPVCGWAERGIGNPNAFRAAQLGQIANPHATHTVSSEDLVKPLRTEPMNSDNPNLISGVDELTALNAQYFNALFQRAKDHTVPKE